MSTAETEITKEMSNVKREEFNSWFDEQFDEKMAKREADHVASLSIIATKGTLDMAYPPFILASTAAALGWNVNIFFTFYGLELLKKDLNLAVSPLGNPAMPMRMPIGPDWFKGIEWNIPNAVASNVPGFESFATSMMKKTVASKGIASIEELRELSLEAGVVLSACQMTVDLFGHNTDDFIPEVSEWVGAASFLPVAQKSDVTLFI